MFAALKWLEYRIYSEQFRLFFSEKPSCRCFSATSTTVEITNQSLFVPSNTKVDTRSCGPGPSRLVPSSPVLLQQLHRLMPLGVPPHVALQAVHVGGGKVAATAAGGGRRSRGRAWGRGSRLTSSRARSERRSQPVACRETRDLQQNRGNCSFKETVNQRFSRDVWRWGFCCSFRGKRRFCWRLRTDSCPTLKPRGFYWDAKQNSCWFFHRHESSACLGLWTGLKLQQNSSWTVQGGRNSSETLQL